MQIYIYRDLIDNNSNKTRVKYNTFEYVQNTEKWC